MATNDTTRETANGTGPITFTWAGALDGARRGLPLAVSVCAYGLVFGVLARQARLGLGEAALMSGLVAAGASQFVVLTLWATPLPVLTIVLTTFVVNLRLVLMGAALRPWFARLSPLRAYGSVFFLGDESWALTLREVEAGGRNGAFLLGSGLTIAAAWLGATIVGHTIGATLRDPAQWGLDFAGLRGVARRDVEGQGRPRAVGDGGRRRGRRRAFCARQVVHSRGRSGRERAGGGAPCAVTFW